MTEPPAERDGHDEGQEGRAQLAGRAHHGCVRVAEQGHPLLLTKARRSRRSVRGTGARTLHGLPSPVPYYYTGSRPPYARHPPATRCIRKWTTAAAPIASGHAAISQNSLSESP